ncbi:MAG: hypothetical protein ACE5J3_12920 [Methanosarcinales archaeon]
MGEWNYEDGLPLVQIEIINPYNSKQTKKLALVDSGSDWCSVPYELWNELNFFEIGLLELGTPTTGWTEVSYSWCYIILENRKIPVELHYSYDDEVLIVRNLMKYFIITLDGINSRLEIK